MNKKDLQQKNKKLTKEIKNLENKSASPDIINNLSKIKKISKSLNEKRQELAIIKKLIDIYTQIDEAKKMSENETDEEFVNLANEELKALKAKKKNCLGELDNLKNGPKKKNINECIVEIRAGTGGEEANLFASDLFRMYSQYAISKGWKVNIMSKHQSDKGGFKEIIFQISGKKSYNQLKYESGVHRVQRIPVTESSGRIHTSASSVVVFPLINNPKVNINPADLKFDVYRSSGPGGQSVNTTDSAVRITHIPSGTVVTCQDEKSQHKNKKKALSVLASRLADIQNQNKEEKLSKIRKSAIKTGDRSAKIRTYNFPQNRVTDHRIKKSWHNLKSIIDGDLDKIIKTIKDKS